MTISDTEFAYEHNLYENALNTIEKSSYDLIHSHSMHYMPLTSTHQFQSPVIHTFHVPPFPLIKMGLLSSNTEAENQYYTTVSHNLGMQYSQILTRSKVIYNGIDTGFWEFTGDQGQEHLIWFGRICKEKAPHLAVEAALKTDKKIILAGPISNKSYFEEVLKPLIVHPQVIYKGHLCQKDLKYYIQKSLACLFTSVWEEPFGLGITESLACGTPVIAWKKGAAPEILTTETGIIIDKTDTTAMAQSITEIKKISRENCRKHVVEHFSKEKMVQNYLRFYRDVIHISKSACK